MQCGPSVGKADLEHLVGLAFAHEGGVAVVLAAAAHGKCYNQVEGNCGGKNGPVKNALVRG